MDRAASLPATLHSRSGIVLQEWDALEEKSVTSVAIPSSTAIIRGPPYSSAISIGNKQIMGSMAELMGSYVDQITTSGSYVRRNYGALRAETSVRRLTQNDSKQKTRGSGSHSCWIETPSQKWIYWSRKTPAAYLPEDRYRGLRAVATCALGSEFISASPCCSRSAYGHAISTTHPGPGTMLNRKPCNFTIAVTRLRPRPTPDVCLVLSDR